MKNVPNSIVSLIPRLTVLVFLGGSALASKHGFRAGAARVDITPSEGSALQMSGYDARKTGFTGIHDHLYVRAVVMDDGATKAVIITYDLYDSPAGVGVHHLPGGARQAAYIEEVEKHILEATRSANKNLEPAKVGFGTGRANVNMNRTGLRAPGGYFLGLDPDGPSDKTLAVLKIESLFSKPIAILVDYAVHGDGMGQGNHLITADIPGAASRFVEQHFGDSLVAPFTSGAAGDQDPIYRWEATDFRGVETIGMLLGEEVLRVISDLQTWPEAHLRGVQKVIVCPGRKLLGGQLDRKDLNYQFADADPVEIRLSLLTIGHINLVGVSGEVFTLIEKRLKEESPIVHTVMVAHCNGSSGYIPNDAAFAHVSYEIQVSHLKPGCAEIAIVNTLLEMMGEP